MRLTLDQLRTIEDALEYACSASIADFEANQNSREVQAIQRAIRAARDAKRFNAMLFQIKDRCLVADKPAGKN